ncbi:hypothetical protein ACJX0J_010622, partial [Zea mays]
FNMFQAEKYKEVFYFLHPLAPHKDLACEYAMVCVCMFRGPVTPVAVVRRKKERKKRVLASSPNDTFAPSKTLWLVEPDDVSFVCMYMYYA